MIRAAVIFLAGSSPAFAQMDDLEMLKAASNLATVISAETFCGLTYDQTAIQAYIAATIPPERMDFAANLQTATMGAVYLQKDMSASAKTAHCAAVSQTARHFGFIN